MANALKGEVAFAALGQQWTGALTINARCAVEEAHDRGFMAVALDALGESGGGAIPADGDAAALVAFSVDRAQRINLRFVRSLLFHALRERHGDVTVEQVGQMIDELGEAEALGVVSAMVNRSSPQGEGEKAGRVPGKSRARTNAKR